MVRKRLISLASAIALVLSLFTLLPEGALKAVALTDSFTYRDANNVDWYCRIHNGNITSGDVLLSSVSFIHVKEDDRPGLLDHLDFPSVVYDGENNAHTVTKLGVNGYQTNIFENKEEVRSITLPDTITTIFPNTFNSCPALEEINIPKSLKEIKKFTFYHCLKLKSITLPDGLETIGQSAFDTCPALTEVTIPDSVTKLGISCFIACTSLTSVKLPSGITEIPDSAFMSCKALTSISFPDTLKKIGEKAFSICWALTELELPDSLESIGFNAFAYTKNLTSVKLPNNPALNWDQSIFLDSGFTSFTVPSCMEKVPAGFLRECKNLKTVIIEDGVKSIGIMAFYNSKSLETIFVPKSVTAFTMNADRIRVFDNISENATIYGYKNSAAETEAKASGKKFVAVDETAGQYLCPDEYGNLWKYIIVDGTAVINGLTLADSEAESVTVPSSLVGMTVTSIRGGGEKGKDSPFADTSLKRVDLPNTLTSIGNYAFNKCGNLTEINFAKDTTGLKSIGRYAFSLCTSITRLDIPYGVETVDEGAFSYLYAYTDDFILPDSVRKAGASCFFKSAFHSVDLSDRMEYIDEMAFDQCPNLTTISVPNSVAWIGDRAFANCEKLEIVYIPKSVTKIYNNLSNNRPMIFDNTPSDLTVYGYTGTAAQKVASDPFITKKFVALDDEVKKLTFSLNMENGEITFTRPNGTTGKGINNISSNWIDKSKPVVMNATVPEGSELTGYEITYDYTVTDKTSGLSYSVYYKTVAQSTEENTIDVSVPAILIEKLIPYFIYNIDNSDKPVKFVISGKINAKAVLNENPKTDLGTLRITLDENNPSFLLNAEQNYAVKAAIKSSTEAGEINSSFGSIIVDVDLDKDGTVDFDIEYFPLHNKNYMWLKNPNFIGTFKYTFTEDEIAQLKQKDTEGYYSRVNITLSGKKYQMGDINHDGSVDRIDANLLSRYVAGWDGYEEKIFKDCADLNDDGDINRIDANILSRCVADWDGYREKYIK